MRIRFCIGLSFLILLASYGCGGGSSAAEMNQARMAMDKAKSWHADDLAPTDFQQAQKAWDRAQVAVKEDKTATAKVLFESARIFFVKAADIAKSKRDALSRELSGMQLMISSNLDQVQNDLSKNNLSPKLKSRVKAIVSEVEKDNATIRKLVHQEDFVKAVETARAVQTKIYNAQLILAGKSPIK